MIRLIRNCVTGGGDSWPSDSGNLLEWLQENAPDIADKRVIVEFNGVIICDTSEHNDPDKRCDREFSEEDNVIVRVLPEGLDPLTIGLAVGGILLGVASTLLIPKPQIPNNAGEQQTSSNNQLNASSNAFRPGQAIPDIAGEVVSFPDFLQPSLYEYVDNRRSFIEVMAIGVDELTHDRVRSESTDFDEIEGASFDIYKPGDTPPTLLLGIGTNDVDGFEPTASDDPSVRVSLDGGTVSSTNLVSGVSTVSVGLQDGDLVDIEMTWNDGNDFISLKNAEVSDVYPGSFRLVGSTLNNSQAVGDVVGFLVNKTSEEAGQFFNTVGSQTEQIWTQVIMPQGIRSADGGSLVVTLDVTYQQIDSAGIPLGSESIRSYAISGSTINAQRRTFKITGLTPARYRVRVTRTSESEPEGGRDRVQIEDILAVRSYTPNFGSLTWGVFNRIGTDQPLSSRDSKVNLIARDVLPIFDPNTGTFGAAAPNRSFAQYVMYLHTLGGGSIDKIDYQGLFEIEQSLPGALIRFDFTFDDNNVGLKERIATACNAARVRAFNIGGDYLAFARDESKPVNQALFGRRDVAPRSVKESWLPHRSSDFESVEIEYVNPETNAPAYERRRITTAGVIENGAGLRMDKMKLAGCRTVEQAQNRADYEIRKMRYQRRRLSITALRSAQDVIPGMRVAVESMNDSEVFGGEILAVDGDTYYTSEQFVPEAGKDYYVYITDEEGALSNQVLATAVSGNKKAFSASGLTAFVADGYDVQVGSRYVIAEAADHERQSWTVISRGRADEFGRVNLELVNYDERVFSED